MPNSNGNTQLKRGNRNSSELAPVPAILLRFRKPLILLAHILTFAVSLMLSFLLTNDMRFNRTWLVDQYPMLLLLFLIVKLPVFGLFKQYRGWWRYVGISDLTGILRASLTSTLIIVVLWFVVVLNISPVRTRLENIARIAQSIFFLDLAGTFLGLAGLRMLIRLYFEEFRTVEAGRLKRFIIVGAGDAGEELLRSIHRNPTA